MRVHLAPHLLVLLPLLPVPLAHGQASQLPGIAAWKAAIQQHSLAEGKAVPLREGEVPGLASWEAHQRAVLEAEKKLEQSGEYRAGEELKGEERVNTHVDSKNNAKASIIKLLSKLTGKAQSKGEAKSKVESLLEAASQKKLKEEPKEESFLDKLLEVYSLEERKEALQLAGKVDPVLNFLEERRQKKHRTLRRKSSLGVLSGDYLERLSGYADYDDYDFVEDIPVFSERVRSSSAGRLSSAAKASRLIERQLRKLLRN